MIDGPRLNFFLSAPRRRYADSEFDAYMERWVAFTCPPMSLFLSYAGDKCDVARSRFIGAAKGEMPLDDPGYGFRGDIKLVEPPGVTACIDDDVFPRTTGREIVRLINQDFEDGYDVVGVPTVNSESLQTMVWTKDGTPLTDKCIPVTQVAFGFVAFSPKFIREVKPEAEEIFYEGTPNERRVPLYCHFGINEDDSSTFSRLIIDQGFKLGADPRIVVTHRKAYDLDPASAQWAMLFRSISRAQRGDLFLRCQRIVRRGLEQGVEDAGTGANADAE